MKEFWVDIVRREVTFERNCILVKAESAEHAQERVSEHYLGEGDGVLTYEEESTEQHSKHLETDESIVVFVGDAEEAV